MIKNEILSEKKVGFWKFSISSKIRYFAGFAMRKLLYFDTKFKDFDSKTWFGKYIKFYYEVDNTKIQFEIIIVVYGSPGVDQRCKISNLGQMFSS